MINFSVHGSPVAVYWHRKTTGAPGVSDTEGWDINKGTINAVLTDIAPMEAKDKDGRVVTTTLLLVAPGDAPLEAGCQIEVEGERYDCLGTPVVWKFYAGWDTVHHLQVPLRRA